MNATSAAVLAGSVNASQTNVMNLTRLFCMHGSLYLRCATAYEPEGLVGRGEREAGAWHVSPQRAVSSASTTSSALLKHPSS